MGNLKAQITISEAIDILDDLTKHPNYRRYNVDEELVQQALYIAIHVLQQQERRNLLWDIIEREE